MKCRVCGGQLESRITDLPFKVGDLSIVILRSLPVLQCRQCGETELEQLTMSRVDQLLAAVDVSAELEVIRYAASLESASTVRGLPADHSRQVGPPVSGLGYDAVH